jgi:hypothetical protein
VLYEHFESLEKSGHFSSTSDKFSQFAMVKESNQKQL